MRPYQTLEKNFAKFSGKKYAIAVNTGTAALHLSLLALGIGPGDEVIVPDFTFVACAFAVTYTGARPIFVDCADDLNIDPDLIEAKITAKTKAIMAVHIYGRKCQMEKILKIAKRNNLKVIEDASEAHGVKLSDSDIACYSFQQTKIIHSEEGGMIVTNKRKLYLEMQELKSFYNLNGRYDHRKLSFNYRMPDSQAILALKSLEEFDVNIEKRRKAVEKVTDRPPYDSPWVIDKICKSQKIRNEFLNYKGYRCFFKPMSTLLMYRQKPGKKALHYSRLGLIMPIKI